MLHGDRQVSRATLSGLDRPGLASRPARLFTARRYWRRPRWSIGFKARDHEPSSRLPCVDQLGTNPKIVSEVLGHKEITITLDRYSHALPTMQATAMARLDAILGRGDDAPPAAESDKGSNKGSPTPAEASERPDPSVDRARNGEFGTAYRIRTGDLRLERAVSWASRRMRRGWRPGVTGA
jgi:hypothetical protein